MANRVFFSWQSDLESKYTRNFVKSAVTQAIKAVSTDFYYDEAARRQVGSVDISEVLFHKIRTSTVVIADVTTINKSANDIRKGPNPNVAIELGYAAAVLGWSSIIPIFNTAYGDLQDVPFDIRNRRILTYHLDENSDQKEEKKKLVSSIANSLEVMELDAVKKRDSILRAFANHSERVRFHALYNADDGYRNAKLMCELLKEELDFLRREVLLIKSHILFSSPRKMDSREFFNWLQASVKVQERYLQVFNEIVDNQISPALLSEDPVVVLRYVETLARIGKNMIEFELDKNSVILDERLERFRHRLGPRVEGYVSFLENLIGKLETTVKDGENTITISNAEFDAIYNLDATVFIEIQNALNQIENG